MAIFFFILGQFVVNHGASFEIDHFHKDFITSGTILVSKIRKNNDITTGVRPIEKVSKSLEQKHSPELIIQLRQSSCFLTGNWKIFRPGLLLGDFPHLK